MLERVFVWAHVSIILGFLVYLPYSKHLHIFTAAINVFFGRTRARGRLEPLRFDEDIAEAELRFGAGTVADLTWKQMVDAFSCTECGRCQDVCPAWATGKVLSPKLLIMGVRDQLFAEGPLALRRAASSTPIVGNGVPEEMVWDCVTCGACIHECPVEIEHVDHIVDLRRQLVMVESRFPAEAGHDAPRRRARRRTRGASRRSSARTGRTGSACACSSRATRRRRCSTGSAAPPPSTSARAPRPSRPRSCCRRPASTSRSSARASRAPAIRRAAWATSTSSSRSRSRTWRRSNEAGVTKIVASCPHCFNTLANEYPDFGGRYEVVHHTELLAELVRDGRLAPAAGDTRDHLPRLLLPGPPQRRARASRASSSPPSARPVEMERSGKRTFCCGAGGAHMWMEERAGAINEERVREAAETGAGTLAVACPFCTVMLDDGVRNAGRDLRVVDVATLLAESLEPESQRRRRGAMAVDLAALADSLERLGTETAFSVLARAKQLEREGRRHHPSRDRRARLRRRRPHICEAGAAAIRAGHTHYCPSAGLPELREAAAEYLARTRGLADPARATSSSRTAPSRSSSSRCWRRATRATR